MSSEKEISANQKISQDNEKSIAPCDGHVDDEKKKKKELSEAIQN